MPADIDEIMTTIGDGFMNTLKRCAFRAVVVLVGAAVATQARTVQGAPTAEELGVVAAPQLPPRGRTETSEAKAVAIPIGTARSAAIQPSTPPPVGCSPEDAPFLPTGFSFPALLPDAIYSYALSAPVMATLEDDVKFRDRLVFPRGTRLVGNASAVHTLDRVNINWSLAILPEGCEFPISAIALSADDGSSGIKGKREMHEDHIAAHIALKSMITAARTAAAAASPAGSLESALAGNFSNEAGQDVDHSLGQVKSLDSIYINERMAIRIFVLHRFVRPSERR